MDFKSYLEMPIHRRAELILAPIKNIWNVPFWQERLNTAITNHAPLAVSLDKQLLNEYWNIMTFKNHIENGNI